MNIDQMIHDLREHYLLLRRIEQELEFPKETVMRLREAQESTISLQDTVADLRDDILGATAKTQSKRELHAIRKQLVRMDEFMTSTPDMLNNAMRWIGSMPAYPKKYTPENWQPQHKPIYILWQEYLTKLEREGLVAYRKEADKLALLDLLTASKEERDRRMA